VPPSQRSNLQRKCGIERPLAQFTAPFVPDNRMSVSLASLQSMTPHKLATGKLCLGVPVVRCAAAVVPPRRSGEHAPVVITLRSHKKGSVLGTVFSNDFGNMTTSNGDDAREWAPQDPRNMFLHTQQCERVLPPDAGCPSAGSARSAYSVPDSPETRPSSTSDSWITSERQSHMQPCTGATMAEQDGACSRKPRNR
jgi:hypothetical protein